MPGYFRPLSQKTDAFSGSLNPTERILKTNPKKFPVDFSNTGRYSDFILFGISYLAFGMPRLIMTNFPPNRVSTSIQAPAPALDRTPLKDQVSGLLRDHIVKGKLPSGSKLIERELAEWLGVSRMPVHDALIQLEKEGLVVTRPDARYVIQLTRQDLLELFQTRVVLERLAAELAAKNNSPENSAQFEPLLQEMKKSVDRLDIETFIDEHMQIHRLIWQQSRNPHLQKALNAILGPIQMFMARSELINWDNTLARHGGIIDAIQAGDPTAAGECMARHIIHSLEHTLQSFDEK